MEIVHDEAKKQFKVEVDGYTAHVASLSAYRRRRSGYPPYHSA